MRIFRHRSTAFIAGLAYWMASALSGSLHRHIDGGHEHGDCADASHRGIVCLSHDAIDDHTTESEAPSPEPPSPEPLSDDDCLACRFVAQSAVVTVPLAEVAPRPLVAEVRVSAPKFFLEPVYSNSLARAPPLG